MSANFQLLGLDPAPFEALFSLSDDALTARGARRYRADEAFSFPCRVGLEDAEVGETLLLLPFAHQAEATPYRASGPVFVRQGSRQARLAPGLVPPYVTRRWMSLRAYDAGHMMIDACVCEGPETAQHLQAFFKRTAVAYVHLHNAKRGCFSCVAQRA